MNLNFLHRILNKYDYLKQNRLYEFVRSIIFPFGLKLISRLFRAKVDDNLIVMSAYGGYAYLDNTKYLFEYLNKHSDYKLVWITRSHELQNEIRSKGYRALYIYDLEAIRLLRKAKYVFITHGYVDILPIEFSSDTCIILTWHGTPIKIINPNLRISAFHKKWEDIFRLNLDFDQYITYILTPTGESYEHEIIKKAFKILEEKILDIGYPRNDILFERDEILIKKLREFYRIPNKIKKIFLYAPTFRNDLILRFPITKPELDKLNEVLIENKYLFLLKSHLFEERIDFKEYKNIKLVEKTADIQELLVISDVLLTDYSSVIFDYLLTMKPILLFTYDLEKYKKEVGMYYNFEEIAPGPLLFNGQDLVNSIKNIDKIDKEYEDFRKKIRNRFNKYKDGKTIERLLNFLNIKHS